MADHTPETDAEINRAVAQACGLEMGEDGSDQSVWTWPPGASMDRSMFDPITNWSDCGPLIARFQLTVDIFAGVVGQHNDLGGLSFQQLIDRYSDPDAALRRAICRVVVKMSDDRRRFDTINP